MLLLPVDVDLPTFGLEARDIVVGWFVLHGEGGLEALPDPGQRDAILRAFRPGEAGLDGGEVKLE